MKMADYIDRKALLHKIRWASTPEECVMSVRRMQAIDVAPAKRGQWIENLDDIECSVCGRQWNYCDNDTNTFNFCPNCGAAM